MPRVPALAHFLLSSLFCLWPPQPFLLVFCFLFLSWVVSFFLGGGGGACLLSFSAPCVWAWGCWLVYQTLCMISVAQERSGRARAALGPKLTGIMSLFRKGRVCRKCHLYLTAIPWKRKGPDSSKRDKLCAVLEHHGVKGHVFNSIGSIVKVHWGLQVDPLHSYKKKKKYGYTGWHVSKNR